MYLAALLGLITSVYCYKEFKEEDGVLVLTEDNFEFALKQFPYLMVEFYAPWCVHCQKFAPEFTSAAISLKREHIILAKVDATEAKNLSARFMLRGYPTLKFFRSGRPKNYDGRRSAFDLVEWLKIHSVPLVTVIENRVELELFKEQQNIVLMYFSAKKEKENDQNVFATMADQLEGVFFGLAQSVEMRQQLGLEIDDKIVLYTPYDDNPIKMKDDVTLENIWYFVQNNSYPTVLSYTFREKLFVEEMEHSAVYLFLDGVEPNIPEEKEFEKAAIKLKGQFYFVRISKVEKDGREAWLQSKFYDKFGVREFPSMFLQDTRGIRQHVIINPRPFKKYKFKGNLTEESILQYIEDFKEDKLKPFYKSQKVPLHQKGLVREIVGKSFQWEVVDNDKEVLMMFHAPWDSTSRQLSMVLDHIASKLQVNPNVVLAKFDATENEIPDMNVETYPTLYFFQAGELDELKVVDFYGQKTFEGILSFIKAHTKFPWVDIEGFTEADALRYELKEQEEKKKQEQKEQKEKEEQKKEEAKNNRRIDKDDL